MLALENLHAGDLAGSLSELQDAVRSDPSDSKKRIFLFQLLSVLGEWQRALTQLKVLGDMDSSTLPMVQTYREALQCEVFREEVFSARRTPLVFGDPEAWIAELIQALKLTIEGHHAQAAENRERAFEAAPATSGSINGDRFEWIADADSRLGPMVEMIVNGSYYWVPFSRIFRLDAEKPGDLRDFVWAPVTVTWANGGQTVALIPNRYPGTERSDNDDMRLARRTEWQHVADDVFVGMGQRLFATDSGDYSLLDLRKLQLDTATVGEEPAGDDSASA